MKNALSSINILINDSIYLFFVIHHHHSVIPTLKYTHNILAKKKNRFDDAWPLFSLSLVAAIRALYTMLHWNIEFGEGLGY